MPCILTPYMGCCCKFSSVAQSCPTLCNSMDCRMPGFPVLHRLLKFVQTHVHWVGDVIQPFILCHPFLLLSCIFPSIRVFSNELALPLWWPKYWSFSISPSNEYSVLISFRIDWFDLLAVQGSLRKESSPCWLSILNIAVYTCESQTPFTSIFRLSFP